MKLKTQLLLALVVYIFSAVGAYGAFSTLQGRSISLQPTPEPENGETALSALLDIAPNEPQDQPCPLNGAMYTMTERNAWEQRRPLAVMVENHPEARPQSGLSAADVVFEIMAEGGVTRFMPIYYCRAQREDITIAPVRSARKYFVDYAAGFNRPLYAHVGGSNVEDGRQFRTDALGFLGYIGWNGENDLNQFSIGYPTFVRDYNRLGKDVDLATEHTMVTTSEELWLVGADRGWTQMSPELQVGRTTVAPEAWSDGYTGWSFRASDPEAGTATQVAYEFWDGFSEYGVQWDLDASTKMYKRTMAGAPHVDLNSDQQIMAKNVVILFAEETGPINEKKHMVYETTGSGDALVFINGQAIEATWSKKTFDDELTFQVDGQPLEFAPGLIWLSVVDVATEIAY